MLRHLIATIRFDLSFRSWEQELAAAVQLFWIGDLAAANQNFEQLMRRVARFLNIVDEKPAQGWLQRRLQEMKNRVLSAAYLAVAGRWAIAYVQKRFSGFAHPPIPDDTTEAREAWQFITAVHISLSDLHPDALRLYAKAIRLWPDKVQQKQIERLVHSAPRSKEAVEVLQAIFDQDNANRHVAHRLCIWLLEEGRIADVETTADIYLGNAPDDAFILDILAYIAEVKQDWTKAGFFYARVGDFERAAFMAMLGEDSAKVSEYLRAIPAADRQTPMGHLCQGWLAFSQQKYNAAIDNWVHVTLPDSNLQENVAILFALRSMEQNPLRTYLEIEKVSSRIPEAGMVALAWITGRLSRQILSQSRGAGAPPPTIEPVGAAPSRLEHLLRITDPAQENDTAAFLRAVVTSFALSRFRTDRSDANYYLRWLPRPQRRQIEALQLAHNKQWLEALSILEIEETITPLQRLLVQNTLADSLRERDWDRVVILLRQWRPFLSAIVDLATLEDLMLVEMWRERNYESLATELLWQLLPQRRGNLVVPRVDEELSESEFKTLTLHHNAALVLHKLAMAKGALELWKQSMSHWAVVLSDQRYWQAWYERRQPLYGIGASVLDVKQLPERVAQALGNRPTIVSDGDAGEFTDIEQRTFNRAFLAWEWESVIAVRHVLTRAADRGVAVPEAAISLLSPTLMTIHAPEALDALLGRLVAIKPDEDANNLLRSAFSPEADIRLLHKAGHYELALKVGASRQIQRERLHPLMRSTYELLIQEKVNRGSFEEAFELAQTALNEYSDDRSILLLFASTAAKWAQPRLSAGNYEEVILQLNAVPERVRQRLSQLNPVFAEAYVVKGKQLLNMEDEEAALDAFLTALRYEADNEEARQLVSVIYHNIAINAFDEGLVEEAQRSAERSLTYQLDEDTMILLIEINTSIAETAAAAGQWSQVDRCIETILEYGEQIENPAAFTTAVSVLTEVLTGDNRRAQAIKLLEAAADLRYDTNIMEVTETLAELMTLEGEECAQRGQTDQAERLWRIAVYYDPENRRAENQLRRLEATQWRQNL